MTPDMAVVTPLNNFLGPEGDTVTMDEQLLNTEYCQHPASSSLTHARRMDGFCNQNADQLGSLAGPLLLTVYVGVVECAPAFLPPASSSLTHARWMVSATRTPTSSAPSQDYLFPLYM